MIHTHRARQEGLSSRFIECSLLSCSWCALPLRHPAQLPRKKLRALASPRFLLVTVVQAWVSDIDGSADDDTLFAIPPGPHILDRCGGRTRMRFSDVRIYPQLPDIPGARTYIRLDADTLWSQYFVEESLHDICRALADCADATAISNDSTSHESPPPD